jgi:hypothetical protein
LSFSAPAALDSAPDQYFWQQETDALLQNQEMPAVAIQIMSILMFAQV